MVKNEIEKRIKVGDGAAIACFGSFNAQDLVLTVDTLIRSALVINGVLERIVAN